jgi:hypothetical protein
MELSWINKLRIAAVAALGILVIGILAWPLAAPQDPELPVRAGMIGPFGTLVLLVLAFAVGCAGYFIAWPHGREMGILAVPLGLAIWAGRSGPMRALTQIHPEASARQALVHSLTFEPLYWLLIVAAGFAGVLAAQSLRPVGAAPAGTGQPRNYRDVNTWVNGLAALVAAIVVSHFFMGVLAQNLGMPGVDAQPEIGQIIFAVTAAFALAGFVVKKFLHLSYLWAAAASLFIPALTQVISYQGDVIQKFAEARPATIFPNSVFAILPLQLVALGTLGSIIGYWIAVRYDYWRQHESAG